MGNIFAGSEVIEIGIRIEENGRDFYRALAGKAEDTQTREVFEYLAGEEARHITAFRKILDSVNRYEPQESYASDYLEYMNALAGEYIFTQEKKSEEAAGKAKRDKEAADMAIGFEKDSIIFYDGMKEAVQEYDHKAIERIISEEKSHLKKLFALKARLG